MVICVQLKSADGSFRSDYKHLAVYRATTLRRIFSANAHRLYEFTRADFFLRHRMTSTPTDHAA